MKNKTIPIIILLLCMPSLVMAAPSISGVNGTVSHNSQIVISGSGFGTHANYGDGRTIGGHPYLNKTYKEFGNSIFEEQGWEFFYGTGDSTNWRFSSTYPRRPGKPYAQKYMSSLGGDRLNCLSINQTGITGQWFVSLWFMPTWPSQSGKFWRMYGAYGNDVTLFTGCSALDIRGEGYIPDMGINEVQWGSPDQFTPNQWSRVDIFMDQAASIFSVYKDGVFQWTRNDFMRNPFGEGHTMDLANVLDNGQEPDPNRESPCLDVISGTYSYDEVYVDYTQARVEISDSPIWNPSSFTHREIQIPNTWSANSVTMTVNRGSFTNGQQAYVYVVDSTGAVNANGYPVTFGSGGGDTIAPSAPSGLIVQ